MLEVGGVDSARAKMTVPFELEAMVRPSSAVPLEEVKRVHGSMLTMAHCAKPHRRAPREMPS